MIRVLYFARLREQLDTAAIQDRMRADNPAIGALVSFVGLMRDMNEGDQVATMTLEHYPGKGTRTPGHSAIPGLSPLSSEEPVSG